MFGHDMNPNSDIYTVAICTGTSTVTEKKDIKIGQKKYWKGTQETQLTKF